MSGKFDITNPIFHDETAAREHLERLLWPHGPMCPRCGATGGRVTRLQGKSTRPGVHNCKDCRKPFTVTVGTVMERSHVPLHKWVLAAQLMASSKKGFSAHELHRLLGTNYETAWFLFHRLREAAAVRSPTPLSGEGKVVEADGTYVGGKAKNRAYAKAPPKKAAVVALVERDGEVRSLHVPNVTATTLRPVLVKLASRKSVLMTDESTVYPKIGAEFTNHLTVNHSANEYVRLGSFVHTNTVEGYFSILKRGIYGTFHHVSEAHLGRYLAEFDFRANTRALTDGERAATLLAGAKGKRLLYRRPDAAANA